MESEFQHLKKFEPIDFNQYLEKVKTNPKLIRTAFQYLRDAINYFNEYKTEVVEDCGKEFVKYKLFADPFLDGLNAVIGNVRSLDFLVKNIDSIADQKGLEKILILIGPPGSGKATIVELLMKAVEAYSKTEEGIAYTIAWDDGPCPYNDKPISLLPLKEKKKFFKEIGLDQAQTLLNLEACTHCQRNLEDLIKSYSNIEEAFSQIKVVPFFYSLMQNRGLVEITPGKIDDYEKLKNLASRANQGIIYYNNIFTHHLDNLLHLLRIVESKILSYGEDVVKLDAVVLGSSQPELLQKLQKEPKAAGLLDRCLIIEVPYLVNYLEEEKIHNFYISQIRKDKHISPHTIEIACLFAVMTRLLDGEKTKFYLKDYLKRKGKELDDKKEKALRNLTLIKKAKLYANELSYENEFDEIWRGEEGKKFLNEVREACFHEEGRSNFGPRWLSSVFSTLKNDNEKECIDCFDLYEIIETHIPEKFKTEYSKFLDDLKNEYIKIIKKEIENVFFHVTPEEIKNAVFRYLEFVSNYIMKKRIIIDPKSKNEINVEEFLKREEKNLEIQQNIRESALFDFSELTKKKFEDEKTTLEEIKNNYKNLGLLISRYENILPQLKRDKIPNVDVFTRILEKTKLVIPDKFSKLKPEMFPKEDLELNRNMIEYVCESINRMKKLKEAKEENYCNYCAIRTALFLLKKEPSFFEGKK